MSEFQDFLNEQLQNDDFRKEWEDIQPEMDVIRAMVNARISQNLTGMGMTLKLEFVPKSSVKN